MTSESWALSDDLSAPLVVLAAVLTLMAIGLLAVELRQRESGGPSIFVTGVASVLLLGIAVLRPVEISSRGSEVGPRVVVLVDQSRRLLLPNGDGTRLDRARAAVEALSASLSEARLSVMGFGDGPPEPLAVEDIAKRGRSLAAESDLVGAIASLAATPGERPQAVVVVSDGRLSRPSGAADARALKQSVGRLGVPVHTVKLEEQAPRDASIRAVRAAGAAVAHQPLALTVEVGCHGLECDEIPVTVRELRRGVDPAELGSGTVSIDDDTGSIELEVTLERAGARVIEVSIDAPAGDTIPENDTRLMTFEVARERVRLLHLAGRPTYDVRALRMWLKSDESVDVVAFFILRGETDDPAATDRELALIEFPVDELFTTHLPSFDAVVLQDIDAIKYKLAKYLPRLARYVQAGGGLIMVGGPSSFAGGNYAGTPLDWVLPVEQSREGEAFDTARFEPVYTEAGRAAPVTRALRELYGEDLPRMAGTNILGPARPGAIVLWNHPSLRAGGDPMPVLALGEAGDGRAIALAVDGTHELAFGTFAAEVSGRGYGALWDGLLGWLMRDPRYESARIEIVGECVAGEPVTLRVTRLPGMEGEVELWLERLGARQSEPVVLQADEPGAGPVDITLDSPEAGGYSARVRVGAAPPTRRDFACDRGGAAWADSRPDPGRLEAIADATGGVSVTADAADSVPGPDSTRVAAERRVAPVLPPWAWTLAAASALGVHWVSRRRGGLV